jgi:low temperature requirement protein LtrA
MPSLPSFRIRSRMTGRDHDEKHRVSSPLELLFDLTFVVAVAQVAVQLAHSIADGTVVQFGGVAYLMVFFAIWWAWINFTWFASAYDTDDIPYRLLTMLQMAGVLVLAAGVPDAFAHQQFFGVTLGYFIMRIALVSQWVRAAVENPAGRTTALRYAVGIVVVQAGWILRLLLPAELAIASFVVLALLDVSVPVWAERSGMTPWHPHHIAERYGLFTIILLGESVSAATIAVQGIIASSGVSLDLVIIAAAGLVLIFALWWLYFMESAAEGLSRSPTRSFLWGYGHYPLFAAIAAIGAALEVAVDRHPSASAIAVGYALAVPVALFYLLLWMLHSQVMATLPVKLGPVLVAAVATLLVPLAAPAVGVAPTFAAIAFIGAALTAVSLAGRARRASVA